MTDIEEPSTSCEELRTKPIVRLEKLGFKHCHSFTNIHGWSLSDCIWIDVQKTTVYPVEA